MSKHTRHAAIPALSVLAAALAYGVFESIALLRSRTIDRLIRMRKQLTAP